MEYRYPIHTAEAECQDCYKCVRQCPVKAIKVRQGRASIVPELCIACGHCVEVCPSEAKRVRDDLGRVHELLQGREAVYVSLAPSYVVEFPGVAPGALIAALKRLGFAGVSETALGAQQVSAEVAGRLNRDRQSLTLSSACPAAVEYVQKYLMSHGELITPFLSPLLAHCKMLRQTYGERIGIVFMGPCAAKKREADRHPELLDLVLTFDDVRRWLAEEGIEPERTVYGASDRFVPAPAREGTLYPVEGGMNATIRMSGAADDIRLLTLAGIQAIDRALAGLRVESLASPVFLELLACHGGCVRGPCISGKRPGLLDQLAILERADLSTERIAGAPQVDIGEHHREAPLPAVFFSGEEIRQALKQVGKFSTEDELNCSGCGYETCRELAMALLDGRAEPAMCLSYLRHQAQRKANALLRCVPFGVVIVGADMKVIECNEAFAKTFSEETRYAYAARPGLAGAVLEKIIPFAKQFRTVLRTGCDIHRDTVRADSRIFEVTIFTIEANMVVAGAIVDVTHTELRREQIARRARTIIRKNLETVQEIACRLGENMAETEILLRSLAEGFDPDGAEKDGELEDEGAPFSGRGGGGA